MNILTTLSLHNQDKYSRRSAPFWIPQDGGTYWSSLLGQKILATNYMRSSSLKPVVLIQCICVSMPCYIGLHISWITRFSTQCLITGRLAVWPQKDCVQNVLKP